MLWEINLVNEKVYLYRSHEYNIGKDNVVFVIKLKID